MSLVSMLPAHLTLKLPKALTVCSAQIGRDDPLTGKGVVGELIRQDLLTGEKGPPVHLDINVVDTSACKPVTDAFVELWGTNATVRPIYPIPISWAYSSRVSILVCKHEATVMAVHPLW